MKGVRCGNDTTQPRSHALGTACGSKRHVRLATAESSEEGPGSNLKHREPLYCSRLLLFEKDE